MTDRPMMIKLIDNFTGALGALLTACIVDPPDEKESPRCEDPACDAECVTDWKPMIPGLQTITAPAVIFSPAARGLRAGMSWEEVMANEGTRCSGERESEAVPVAFCGAAGGPCSSCVFLDAALCACGHVFTAHHPAPFSFADDCAICSLDECPAFSLASWPGMPAAEPSLVDVARAKAIEINNSALPYTAVVAPDTAHCIVVTQTVVGARELPLRRTLTLGGKVPATPWADLAASKGMLDIIIEAIRAVPEKPWSRAKIRKATGIKLPDVNSALAHLVSTGVLTRRGDQWALPSFVWPVKEKPTSKLIAIEPHLAQRDIKEWLAESDATAAEESETHRIEEVFDIADCVPRYEQ